MTTRISSVRIAPNIVHPAPFAAPAGVTFAMYPYCHAVTFWHAHPHSVTGRRARPGQVGALHT